jgi:hypothetical protein
MPFRHGQWVKFSQGGAVGIYQRGGDVHLVDKKGETAEIKRGVDDGAIEAVTNVAEIPASRRPPAGRKLRG